MSSVNELPAVRSVDLPVDPPADVAADLPAGRRPADLLVVRVFLVALAGLLVGYMFLGRGFAHLGRPPLYVGEIVLLLGLVSTAIAFVRLRLRVVPSPILVLLLVFMALGLARTLPYLGVYGADALRDAVLWGYAAFALMVYVLADRALVLGALRLYGWVVPVFALWLPISWNLFAALSGSIDPNAPGAVIPLVFFKNQDMAVHAVGSIAFLVLGTGALRGAPQYVGRSLVALPLAWTVYITGSISRGAVAAVVAGLGVLVLLAPRSRNWIPVLAAAAVLVVVLLVPGGLTGIFTPGASPAPSPSVSASPSSPPPSGQPTPTPAAGPTAAPPAPGSAGRATSLGQWFENIFSVLFKSSDVGLEGTKQFRLAWWGKIVDYAVFGPYVWTGKGFGVNLADDDGFQPTADHSLRAPHNSHLTVLARMGVPGLVAWLLLQAAFAIQLLRSLLAHRRAGDAKVAAVGAWILVYWTAMMVNTSFDPYLEGPQGGIWFWVLFGLGLVVIRLSPRRLKT